MKNVEIKTLCMNVFVALVCLNVSKCIACINKLNLSIVPRVPKLTPGYDTGVICTIFTSHVSQ